MQDKENRSFSERRTSERHPIKLDVNYKHGETYLFSRSSNLSELGIFLVTQTPLANGSRIELQFSPPDGGEPIQVVGEVMWIERGGGGKEPGMGVRFVNPTPETRQRLKALIRTIAYLE